LTDVDSLKKIVKDTVDEKRPMLEDIARYLYENPELGSEEYKAFEKLTGVLEDHGFEVEKGIYGMPTAFKASYKGGAEEPRVAVLAEYDALPGVGHGCGHNLIAASAVGAGIAASRAVSGLAGEVLVVGTPAEEGRGPSAGSKVIMADHGFFDDVAGVIMLHPGSRWGVGGQALGIHQVEMVFKGQTSHAAASPEKGRNALNAATLTYVATHMLRQEARRDANLVIHGIIPEGGWRATSYRIGRCASSACGAVTRSTWRRWWTRWPGAPRGPPTPWVSRLRSPGGSCTAARRSTSPW